MLNDIQLDFPIVCTLNPNSIIVQGKKSWFQDLCEKLQIKLRNYKKQVEDAEEIAALNLVIIRLVDKNESH